jgi:hypothetical protein
LVKALQKATASDRIAAVWYNPTFSVDLNFSDTASHQVAIYCLDWDGGRAETIDIVDASSSAVLDSRAVSNFVDGQYLVWNISGHVTMRFTSTGAHNAVVSGLFFDAAGAGTPP